MAEITAANVGKLREMTGVGMMECKKALVEAQGDMEKAVDNLRKSGAASAAKKSLRDAREGVAAMPPPGGIASKKVRRATAKQSFAARREIKERPTPRKQSFAARRCGKPQKRTTPSPKRRHPSFVRRGAFLLR